MFTAPDVVHVTYKGTLNMIDKVIKNYDATVCSWREDLLSCISVRS